MHALTSLGTRLVVVVLATAVVAYAAFVGMTVLRLNQGLERQAEQLATLSEEKLAQRLDGEARLARARVENLIEDVGGRLEAIAQRGDIARAVSFENVVEISELLGEAARWADLDGILVLDGRLRVFGAHTMDLDLVTVHQALQQSAVTERLSALLVDSDRAHPKTLLTTLELTGELAAAVGAGGAAPLAVLSAQPIFDDFGDVRALLVGHRAIRPSEETLVEFSDLDGASVVILRDGAPISHAGPATGVTALASAPGSALLHSQDRRHWGRCAGMDLGYRICALVPLSELHVLRDEMVRIGVAEGRSLTTWLVGLALFSLAAFALITFLASRRITRPLMSITDAVRAVARGDWKSAVPGSRRRDEIGDIARAVTLLQRSLEERDRLRSDVANAESVMKRREALEDAIRRFDRVMRSVLLSVSDCVEAMDETARELARMSAVAEGEAVEAAFVSENTVSNVTSVRGAAESLSASIGDTLGQLRRTADGIVSSTGAARTASDHAAHLAEASEDFEAVVRTIEELNGQARRLAGNASATPGSGPANGRGGADELQQLAARVGDAYSMVADRMSGVRGASGEAVAAIHAVSQTLAGILMQANTIASAMERQDEVTREIARDIGAAADGTLNVSSSVERLKATIEEARAASMKVVTKATEMADEAHRLDSTVKSFLREVTA